MQFAKHTLVVIFTSLVSAGAAALGKRFFKKHRIIGAVVGSIIGSTGAGYMEEYVLA